VIGGAVSLLLILVSASSAFASASTGGSGLGAPKKYVKWVLVDGKPVPTKTGTPSQIVNVINAATRIAGKPYTYGGGHAYYKQVGGTGSKGYTKLDGGYDCSGSVSFALHADGHAGNLLSEPEASGALESYGKPGSSKWITIYTNSEHAYMVVAGLRFDTVAAQENVSKAWKYGDRWSSNTSAGAADTAAAFVKRHPTGW
jgi:hypothetical protein